METLRLIRGMSSEYRTNMAVVLRSSRVQCIFCLLPELVFDAHALALAVIGRSRPPRASFSASNVTSRSPIQTLIAEADGDG